MMEQQGRIPDTIQSCIRLLRNVLPKATISVEIEKPGREGLPELAAEVDVVFYSRSWAEVRMDPCISVVTIVVT
jgi:ketohexokinase